MPHAADLQERSPLDSLAGSRLSVDTVDSEVAILDGMPIELVGATSRPEPPPTTLAGAGPDRPRNTSAAAKVLQKVASAEPQACTTSHRRSTSASGSLHTRTGSDQAIESQTSVTEKRYQRYGHRYSLSGSAGPDIRRQLPLETLSDAVGLERPQPVRSHSYSRSWGAGDRFAPMATPEDNVRMGAQLLAFRTNSVLAHHHWEVAAFPPNPSRVALLLLALGHSEKWFPRGIQVSPQVASEGVDFEHVSSSVQLVYKRLPPPAVLQDLVGPLFPQVCVALSEYASKLLASQLDLEALDILEFLGSLGSAQALSAAAAIYYKGSRRVRKDQSRAARLYARANSMP